LKSVSIKEAVRLVARTYVSNFNVVKGLNLTPVLVGGAGEGKTSVAEIIKNIFNGVLYVIDGTTVKEGEITGMPIVTEDKEFGGDHVTYTPHWVIKKIQNMENKLVDNILADKDKLDEFKNIIDIPDEVNSDINKVRELIIESLGKLTGIEKLELIKKKVIKPAIILVDEINRGSREVMQELMNLLLSRNVNGYDLPWWAFVMATQNPSGRSGYTVMSFDQAQQDRIFLIPVKQKTSEFINWGMESGRLHRDVIDFLSTNPDMLRLREGSHNREGEGFPSPRSWEMCSQILFTDEIDEFKETLNFDDDLYTTIELSGIISGIDMNKSDIKNLILSKIGTDVGESFMSFRDNKDNMIHPSDILTGTKSTINNKTKEKLSEITSLRENVLSMNMLRYMNDNYDHLSKNANKFKNINSQLSEFFDLMNPSNRSNFARQLVSNNKFEYLFDNYFDVIYEYIKDSFKEYYNKFKERIADLK
jgi:hypothetical protein